MAEAHQQELQKLLESLSLTEDARQHQELATRLQQRAYQYAQSQRKETETADEDRLPLLTFQLGGERYAIDVSYVRGVRPCGRVVRVPSVPSFYRGVINVRGQVISVLDLRLFFGMGVDDRDLPRELVLIETQQLYLGLLADHVDEVTTISWDQFEPVDIRYAKGVTSNRLVLLDIEALFSDERLIIGGEKAK